MRRIVVLAAVVMLAVGTFALAEDKKPELPKPGPEVQRLARWVGNWSGEGMMQPGPFGPGGKMSWSNKCDWFEGKYAVVCHGQGQSPMGPSKSVGIITYDSGLKQYTYYGIDSMGFSFLSKGNVEGDTWSFTTDMNIEGKTYYSRFQIKETSPTTSIFTESMSEDGKNWKPSFEGKETKK
jgi:hypothetical protein